MIYLILLSVIICWIIYPIIIETSWQCREAKDDFLRPLENCIEFLYKQIKPYNHVRVKSIENHWHDRDKLLLHASFQILVDFIEEEKPFEIIDYSVSEKSSKEKEELQFLYNWWKNERPKRVDIIDLIDEKDIPHTIEEILNSPKNSIWSKACRESYKQDIAWYKEDTKMLMRLIKIRDRLWT